VDWIAFSPGNRHPEMLFYRRPAMSHRGTMAGVALIAFCSLLCNGQQGDSQADQQANVAGTATVTQDQAGRPVQQVGTTTAAPVPETTADKKQAFAANVRDVYFDFNKADLRPDDEMILRNNAEWLKANPDVAFTIEGDADERGNIVYNVFLSDQRALEARNALVKLGVPESQILYATGWGKLYPVCTESNESCWSQNRRSHFSAWPPEDLSKRAQAASTAASDTGNSEWQALFRQDLLAGLQ
jgi:outer membrane protein OmpA-like peptidoglycan-associated protein